MDWSKSLYREEWNELCNIYHEGQGNYDSKKLMEWMIRAVNRKAKQCNCGNNSKPYCITKEY